ncbi:peptidylprolyl isomerase, partial [Acinetobacter baumannii]
VFRTAERIVDQIQQAGNFAAFPSLARQFSQGTSAASGGDLGWVQPGTLPAELDTAAAGLQVGRISNPIRGPGGYYILALRDRRAIAG